MNTVNEDTIGLLELARALWKNVLVIVLVAVLVGAAAFGYTAFRIAPTYEAMAALYVNNTSFSLGQTSFSISAADLNASNSLVSIYLYILKSRTTLEDVIKEAGLSYTPEHLGEMISAKGVSSTSAFEVTVTSTNPAEAELIANTIAKILPERISEIVDGTSVRIVDCAVIPSHRAGPNLMKNTIIGIFVGAVLCVAVVVVRFLMNDCSKVMIQSPDDLRIFYPDVMLLASIPDMRVSEEKNSYYSSYYGDIKTKGVKQDGRSREV